MKWDKTKKMTDSIGKLAMLHAKYQRFKVDKKKLKPMYDMVNNDDLDSARELLDNIDVNSIVEELEGYMSLDKKHNEAAYNIWKAKMDKGLCWLEVFKEVPVLPFDNLCFILKRHTNEQWTPDELCRYIATVTNRKIRDLKDSMEDLTKTYGIEIETENENTASANKANRRTGKFIDIIQYSNKTKFLIRLHELIDRKGGADVGCVILRALQMNYITRKPTQKEVTSEFKIVGCWSAVHNYMDENNQNALDRANKIVFFD